MAPTLSPPQARVSPPQARVGPPVGPAAADLVGAARRGLVHAALAPQPAEKYVAAHLAALRAAAAVLAVRATGGRARRPASAWALLSRVAPELAEWAGFFAAGARKRAAAEAGLPRAVTAREADDLLRDAETFLGLVEATLGLAHQPALPGGAA
jgi:hypothetical protein